MVESPKKCLACDAIMRPNAVFCHHCGRPLSVDGSNPPIIETQNLSPEYVSVESETLLAEAPTVIGAAALVETLEKAENANGAATITELTGAKIANSETGAPISAAEKNDKQSIAEVPPRPRRPKRYVSRTEYVWEDADAPTWRVVLFSLLALVSVILLLWLNNFLR